MHPTASGRCAQRSTGATTSSTTTRNGASRASRSSPAVRPSRRPRPSRAAASTRSTTWSRKTCWYAARTRTRRPSWACSRRSAPTPRNAWPRTRTSEPCENHYRYYLALAQRHGTERALWGIDARHHLARLDSEIDNLHAALGWAISQANAELALALVAAVGCYWVMRDRYADALNWVDEALNLPGADANPALCVRALRTKAWCLWQVGRGAELPAVLAELEAIAQRLDDPVILTQALQLRVDHELDAERLDVADAHATDALHWAEVAGDEWEIGEASRRKAIATSSIAELR